MLALPCTGPLYYTSNTIVAKRMADIPLKTAVLGLNEDGLALLKAAASGSEFDICAVGDSDINIAEEIAVRHNCTPFDDYRQLVIQNDLDLLLVGAPLHLSDDHIRTAMNKNINVVRLTPPALNFEHGADLVKIAQKNNVRLLTISANRFAPGFMKLRKYIEGKDISQFNLITALCFLPDNLNILEDRWLNDPDMAGGGVLLRNCYHLIDELVTDIGLPEQVFAVSTNHAPDRQQRLSITEDTINITFKFSETLVANLIATRIFGPEKQSIRIQSPKTCITASAGSFTIADNTGKIIERSTSETNTLENIETALKNIAAGITDPKDNPITGDETADLKNMAVIESAYISTRTATPEEPAKILELEPNIPQ